MARFPIQGPTQRGPVSQDWGGYQPAPPRGQLTFESIDNMDPAILEVIGDLILRQSQGEDVASMFQPAQAPPQDVRARQANQYEHPGATMLRDRVRGGAAVNEQGPGFPMRQAPQQMSQPQYQAPRVAGAPRLPAPSMPQSRPRQTFQPLTATTGPYQAINMGQLQPRIPGYGRV